MSNVLDWPYRPRPRIKRAQMPISKLGALAGLMREPALTVRDVQALAHEADAVTAALERMAERCRKLGQTTAAASYRMLADDAHLVASRIEAPALEPIL